MSKAESHPSVTKSSHPPMRLLTERALARRVASGDSRAFAEVFRRHRQGLFGFCVSVLGNVEDAGDALQNTMAKALQALPGETREVKLKPWLFQVAQNECLNMIRARRPADDIAEHDPAGKVSLESTVAGRERLRQLLLDLEHLPERQRGALVMRELNGMSFEEIGAAIDASPGAAKQAVYEARCSLQAQNQGRNMDCEAVRSALSARDGRVSGARRIRAHLRTCEACVDFQTGIEARQRDLRALIPPLPVALVATIAQMFGGGSGGGGGLAASIGMSGGNAMLGGSAMKAVAVLAVTAGLGAGTVGVLAGARDAGQSKESPSGRYAKSVSDQPLVGEASIVGALAAGTDGGLPTDTARKQGRRRKQDGPAGPGAPDTPSRGSGDEKVQPPEGGGTAPVVPGPPGQLSESPGSSGGAQHKGAIPSPGGPPTQLPSASAGGQAHADAHALSKPAPVQPAPAGRPDSPGHPSDAGPPTGKTKSSK